MYIGKLRKWVIFLGRLAVIRAIRLDVAETATSRRQKLEVRCQNFKVSPMATFSNTDDNMCGMDTPIRLIIGVELGARVFMLAVK